MASDTDRERRVAEVGAWLAQYAAARQQLEDQLAGAARSAWLSFDGWYNTQLVAQLAAELADNSRHAQDLVVGAAQQYVASVHAVLADIHVQIPPIEVPPVRNGVDLLRVYTRPAEVFRITYAETADDAQALDRAVTRAEKLATTDVQLASRSAQHLEMRALGVTHYRRVPRPELAKHGSCGLCIVASDRVYTVKDLLPIHGGCNCETMEIVDGHDPGLSLNQEDLEKLYAAAGSTSGDDLKRVKVTVNEHGELGPVLGRKGDHFRGPKQVPLDQDPERAARMLEKVRPVLADLEQRAAAGADVTDPLTYQRDLVDRLSSIVDAAA